MQKQIRISQAYAFCQSLAKKHYENFPVASILLPQVLRRPVAAIYAFARTADDIADEDKRPAEIRLLQLNEYSETLRDCSLNSYVGNDPIFIALQHAMQAHNLPVTLLEDLLTAFRQDVVKSRYANMSEILNYCRYSANPVGRLILHLNGTATPEQLAQSDAICTSLQLINFMQDIKQDYLEQNRIYLPQDRLLKFGIEDETLLESAENGQLSPVIRSVYRDTQKIMSTGIHLGTTLNGRLGWEIRAMTLGGLYTLDKLRHQADRNLLSRPRLSRIRLVNILFESAFKHYYLQTAHRFS